MSTTHTPVLVVGAGFGGIGLGARLRQAGITDFTIIERTDDLGGTWSRNTYPGAACDVPSTLYSYAFAPNPEWSRKYGTQPEILAYLRRVADDFGVTPHVRLGTTLTAARFDEDTRRWEVSTDRGDFTADVLVSAVGAFAEASIPDLPGLSSFGGDLMHTLHWDHDLDLSGKRVGVIGTGATAVQVIPEVQRVADEVVVFQRTPPWIVPRLDRAITAVERGLYRRLPLSQRATRAAWYGAIESFGLPGFVNTAFRHPFEALGRLQLRRQVSDPVLRARLTPDYMIGCKRAIFSDAYYPALAEPNVELVTEPIDEVGPTGVVAGGALHEVDVLILATGFTALPALTEVVSGTDGRTIGDRYRERPQSYLGVANAGFPNMFTVLGPFGAAGNQSAVVMIEAQIDYIVDALTRVGRSGISRFEIRATEQDEFVEEMHARSGRGTWLKGGCVSYYTNGSGLNSGLFPGWSFEYRSRTRRWDADRYDVQHERRGAATEGAGR
ncbi:flavin-containing monooxygenase [Nocardioides caeni]|uniref:NAD(P)/FAD-dependent oxidoreductase n=1 Tax=Nocardioides caeni TaxID=574700 RepID=A0A4S8N3A2_9ACTN|nr:NAD(P)/FAD-dependent oxidoreductase [Nocardioides caeni]THV10487.1 NAD(P)/FAD-dependent oxidoreductase [Nocardioides caeni]